MNKNGARTLETYFSLFLLSASGIALEVSLTRLFSFIFTHSYVYIIISISMAGLGLGSVLMRVLSDRKRNFLMQWISIFPAGLFGILLLVFQRFIVLSLIFTFIIYFCIGMFHTLLFQKSDIRSGKLYAFDLSGAAFGSISAFFILNAAGALQACIFLTAVISLSCLLISSIFYSRSHKNIYSFILLVLLTSAVLFLSSDNSLRPKESLQKEMTLMLNDKEKEPIIIDTRWSSFGRVDLVETNNPLFKTMFIDGAAGTKMIKMDSGQVTKETAQALLYQYMGGVPLLGVDNKYKENALIIGSGGGIDVVTALLAGYKKIDAVEINPDFIDIVKDYDQYNGGIYTTNPQINLIQGEGRAFIRSSDEKYNLILMSLPITKSARNYGNQALTENYLFTYNAFTEYIGQLKTSGILVIVAHYPNELMRLIVNIITTYEILGLSAEEAMTRIITIGTDNSPAIVLKSESFTQDEIEIYYTIMDKLKLRGTTNYIPEFPQQSQIISDADGVSRTLYEFNPGLYNLSRGIWDLKHLISVNSENITPVSDNSPFFYQFNRKLPREVVVVSIISSSLFIFIFILFFTKERFSNTLPKSNKSRIQFLSFGCIGIGFMFTEIALLQKFIIYWQHQTLALAVVLSIILISSGIGSFLSTRIKSGNIFKILILGLIILLTLNTFIVDPILNSTGSFRTVYKFIITFLLAGPCFLLMGLPFPTLLETNLLLRESKIEFPWLIGFNSLASLSGGVFSMVIAQTLGYNWVMILGITAYIFLLVLLYKQDRTVDICLSSESLNEN